MPKPAKPEPVKILSREGLEAAVAELVKLKIEFTRRTAAMEKEIAEVQKRHQGELLKTAEAIGRHEAGVFVFCQARRRELFTGKKSLDLLVAEVGFEWNPFSVEKRTKKDDWADIVARLEAVDWGAQYLTPAVSAVAKAKLIADREALTEEQLAEIGIRFEREEQFFIRPKSDSAAETVKVK